MRASAGALVLTVWLAQTAWAGEVIIHLPDEKIREVITQGCAWTHCEAQGDKTEAQKLAWVADWAIKTGSFGHYDSLKSIQGSLEIRYDQP